MTDLKASLPGAPEPIDAQHASGRLTARERIAVLCDEGSFEEYDGIEAATDGSVVTGPGTINGRRIFIFAKDRTAASGAFTTAHAKKIVMLQERALAAQAPLIGLYDSDGMRSNDRLSALAAYGKIIQNNVEATGLIPHISLIMGPCIGADAFAASFGDFVFMVEETSSAFVTGPEITNRLSANHLNNDIATSETLGGAALHAEKSGLAAATYSDDVTALMELRRFIGFMPFSHRDIDREFASADPAKREEPSLETLVPNDGSAYDVDELISKAVDDSDFFELHADFAKNIVTGFGRFNGRTTGIIANQPMVLGGVLDAAAMQKAAGFINFCTTFNMPIVSFVDAPGFLPGQSQEEGGIARHGANLFSAYASAHVPKITVILGQAFGAALVMMGSKYLGGGSILAWPSARIGLKKEAASIFAPQEALAEGAIDAIIAPSATRAEVITALEDEVQKLRTMDW